jgi:class 3 adenylate cyclase/pimeloyl-ACP methyl ester carboxylesterase
MEPQIQYARTSDGVNIACYAMGSGPVIVRAILPFSHLQAELREPNTRWTHEAITRMATLVRYDHRGFGMSDRDVSSFDLDSFVLDLEAVVERLQLGRFVLVANGGASPVALQYVATNPGRVTHLVLYPGFARPDGIAWKQSQSLAAMAMDDWGYVSEAFTRAAYGWESEEQSRQDAELLRQSVKAETLVKYMQAVTEWDASASVASVRIPTLLVQHADARYTTMEAARRLMADLPDARLHIVQQPVAPNGNPALLAAVAAFLGVDGQVPIAEAERRREAGTAIILFTDIADSTALTERMGDAPFREASRALDSAVRTAIRDAGGTAVEGKVLGDGVMGVFASAAQAIDAARSCLAAGSELPMHIGIHAGDVLRENDNVYGGAVNIASRICGLCEPGEILVSQTVRDLARTSAGVSFEDRGEHALKGIADPVRVFAVRAEA